MKNSFYQVVFFFTLGLSLLISSCGTTTAVADTQTDTYVPKTENTATENQEPQETLPPETIENSVVNNEDTEEEQAERISGDEILQNTVDEHDFDSFTEPFVREAPFQSADNTTKDTDLMDESSISIDKDNSDDSSPIISTESQHEEHSLDDTQIENIGYNVPEDESKTPDVSVAGEEEAEEEMEESHAPSAVQNEIRGNLEEDSLNDESVTDTAPPLSVIIPSRSMTVKNNQYVDIVYPGNGWIYMGETEASSKFRYFGRKLGTADTTFTLRSVKPGNTMLHFYKNDALTAEYIDDYLEVQVENESAPAGERATAPSYAQAVPPKQTRYKTQFEGDISEQEEINTSSVAEASLQSGQDAISYPDADTDTSYTDESEIRTVVQDTNAGTETEPQETSPQTGGEKQSNGSATTALGSADTSKTLLEQAKESLSNKNYETALTQIQSYLDSQNTKIDEALYVQGQILEADSSVRNIKGAIDSYNTLIKRYPASQFWQAANKRKIYLSRYYVNIY